MIIGRPCSALYKGQWISGKIVRHEIKRNLCTIETRRGTVKVKSNHIRLTDKSIWEC
jgi:hypothetical protein